MNYYDYCRWINIPKESSLSAAIESDACFAPQPPQTNWCEKEIISLSGRVTGLNEHFPWLQDHWNNDRLPFFRFLTRKSAPFVMRPRWNQQWNVLVTCARILTISLHRKGLWEDLSILLGSLQSYPILKMSYQSHQIYTKKPPRSFGEKFTANLTVNILLIPDTKVKIVSNSPMIGVQLFLSFFLFLLPFPSQFPLVSS